jgi:hypothetical protein
LIRRRLVELAAENEDIRLYDDSALQGAIMLDQMEDENPRNRAR